MNRVAEDGVLIDWVPRLCFGTTFRIINLIALLQIITILLSGCDVYGSAKRMPSCCCWSFFLEGAGRAACAYHRQAHLGR